LHTSLYAVGAPQLVPRSPKDACQLSMADGKGAKERRIELSVGIILDHRHGFNMTHGRLVPPTTAQGIVDIGYRYQSCRSRDGFACKLVWIAAAIIPFVVAADDAARHAQELERSPVLFC